MYCSLILSDEGLNLGPHVISLMFGKFSLFQGFI